MMNDGKSVLFFCDESNRLNQLIQDKIASHLFLSCNYVPTPYFVQSEDAKFITGVLNLYKFVIDSSVIAKVPNIIDSSMNITFDKKTFDEKINKVKALRTVYSHNESEVSGNDEEIRVVNAWMKTVPQNIDDYQRLNQQLQQLTSEIVGAMRRFINDASRVSSSAALIGNWERAIGEFYRLPNTGHILTGQLKKFYSARKGISQMDSYAERDMAHYAKMYYIGELENKLREKANAYSRFGKSRSLPEKNRIKLGQLLEAVEKELTECKSQIIDRLGDSRITLYNIDRNDYPYLRLYIKELPQKINDLISETPDVRIYGTLLPQDIVQYIVKKDFDQIMN